MDIQMPVMDGLEAARTIRNNPRFAKLPIVAMTAHAMTGDRERCMEAGMNAYLSKPVQGKQLNQTIEGLIAPQPVDATLERRAAPVA
jgi:CheY-like chemotaxis protein